MASIPLASKSANPIVEEEVKDDKEQPCLPMDHQQEAHKVRPDHPIAFPLVLDPNYVETAPGQWKLEPVEVAKVELDAREKEHTLEALRLVVQATSQLRLGEPPSSLDRGRDIIWDWRSIELSENEYGGFAYAVLHDSTPKSVLDIVSYDWTPLDRLRGVLSVRKKCGFQSRLTRVLAGIISKGMHDNKLLTSLVDCVGLSPQIRVSVLTGTVEGMRTPCRCWRADLEERGPSDGVHDFVLEVGMGDKTPELSMLADSYIKRGTLCVMTVKVERDGESDIAWSYSLYRRGKARYSPGQFTTYDTVQDAQDIRVKADDNGVVEFSPELTLFDFVPSEILKKHGVVHKNDTRAVINLSMSLEQLSKAEGRLNEVGAREESIAQRLRQLEELL